MCKGCSAVPFIIALAWTPAVEAQLLQEEDYVYYNIHSVVGRETKRRQKKCEISVVYEEYFTNGVLETFDAGRSDLCQFEWRGRSMKR